MGRILGHNIGCVIRHPSKSLETGKFMVNIDVGVSLPGQSPKAIAHQRLVLNQSHTLTQYF